MSQFVFVYRESVFHFFRKIELGEEKEGRRREKNVELCGDE